jgi:hypothetical protein
MAVAVVVVVVVVVVVQGQSGRSEIRSRDVIRPDRVIGR